MDVTKKPGNTVSGVLLLTLSILSLGVFYLAWGLNGVRDLQSNIGLGLLVVSFFLAIGVVVGSKIALIGYSLAPALFTVMTFYEYATEPKTLLITLLMLGLLYSPLITLWVRHRSLFH